MVLTSSKSKTRSLALASLCLEFTVFPVFLTAQSARPNIAVCVLDRLRADEPHCYVHARFTGPNIDKLASRAVTLSRFYSVAPWRSTSFGTLRSSLYPSKHGVTLFLEPGMLVPFDHRSLCNTALHIPLIVGGPGIAHGQVNPALGSNVDTAPTLLDLVGASRLDDAEGHSFAGLLEGTFDSRRYVQPSNAADGCVVADAVRFERLH
jgi:arylsulfatase A-like enzyme